MNLDQLQSSPEYAITQLMSRPKVPWKCKVEPEQRSCIEFADAMRKHTLSGSYKGIWTHVTNEGKRHPFVAIILRAMGLLPGFSDYILAWPAEKGHSVCVLEFKQPKKKLSEYQNFFFRWCDGASITTARVESADEAVRVLTELGAFS